MDYALPNLLSAVLTRRGFLKIGGVVAGASLASGFGMPLLARAAASPSPQDESFLNTSMFLTGHSLNAISASRFLAALTRLDTGFPARFSTLQAAIQQSGMANMDAFLAKGGQPANVLATANEVVSAWYLGVVGKGKDAVLITFYDALMFEPTRDAVYVPSYGGGPDSWVPTPPFRFPMEKRHV